MTKSQPPLEMPLTSVRGGGHCPKCEGTGINPDALLIEPFHRQRCPLCGGTGWIMEEEGERKWVRRSFRRKKRKSSESAC